MAEKSDKHDETDKYYKIDIEIFSAITEIRNKKNRADVPAITKILKKTNNDIDENNIRERVETQDEKVFNKKFNGYDSFYIFYINDSVRDDDNKLVQIVVMNLQLVSLKLRF